MSRKRRNRTRVNFSQPGRDAESFSMYRLDDPALLEFFGIADGQLPYVTESSALSISAVYRATSLIAGTIATLPLKTYRDSNGVRVRVGSFLDAPAGPEAETTAYEWKETLVVSLLLHGNAYYFKLRNRAGALIGLQYLHPSTVAIEVKDDGTKRYTIDSKVFTDNDILHIPGLSTDGVKGKGVIQIARESMGVTLAGEKQAGNLFKGALVSGLVTPSDDTPWNPEDAKRIKEHIDKRVMGYDNAGQWAVLNRAVKVTPWTLSAKDAQFLESRSFQIDEIARWFGLPPHLLGQVEKQTSWGTGIEEQNHGLARYTLKPITARIEERLSRLLPSPRFCEFDYAGLLQPTPAVEIKLIIEQINNGFITPNEGRALRNLPPIAGGDVLRLPPGSLPPEQSQPEVPE